MNVRTIAVDQIVPAPYNPRIDLKKGDIEYEKLKQSIETFGYVDPLIWNERTGHLVGGHQRLKILQDMGHQEVLVSVVHLDEDREKALNLALNKIEGDWDEAQLDQLLSELDTDLATLAGWDSEELDALIDQTQPPSESAFLNVLIEEETPSPSPGKEPMQQPAPVPESVTVSRKEIQAERELYPVAFSVDPDEREEIRQAIRTAKLHFNVTTSNDAFVCICRDFLQRGG